MHVRVAFRVALLGAGLWLLAGCDSPGLRPAGPATPAPHRAVRPFSPLETALAVRSLRAWHAARALAGVQYELDPYDRRFVARTRRELRDLFTVRPLEAPREDPTFLTVAIDRVAVPQEGYAYAVLRVGNRFEMAEFAYIYRQRGPDWDLLDHYLITEGLLNTVMIDFSWPAYCREKGIELAAPSP